jgi:hypothetical protein
LYFVKNQSIAKIQPEDKISSCCSSSSLRVPNILVVVAFGTISGGCALRKEN